MYIAIMPFPSARRKVADVVVLSDSMLIARTYHDINEDGEWWWTLRVKTRAYMCAFN